MGHQLLNIFDRRRITFDLGDRPKAKIIEGLLELVCADLDVPATARKQLLQALLKREQSGSTGVGRVAIPHAKNPAVPRTIGAVGVFPDGTDFEAVDGDPVYSVFLLLSPDRAAEEHIGALRWIAGLARKQDYTRFVRRTRTPEEVLNLLDELG